MDNKEQHVQVRPWWTFGHVWMIIAGPLVVVVASLTTFYLAVRTPDPVISDDYYRQGLEINKTLEGQPAQANLAPALQARNHAATGGSPTAAPPSKP